ncbi:hypothetical protein [Pseudotamlana agarivorans]|uniref:hypothetical protein n=1 Tax=Pseudotamlana agarivorans TaxID=481183 RepID=UPI000832226C|nr:hypothetical protein [Tamlana agarivorans]
MKNFKHIENHINSFKLKTASLTYFTIFSNSKKSNIAKNLPVSEPLNDFIWSDRLEKALSYFNAAGSEFRNNPTVENCSKYKKATEVYYDALLDKYDCIPRAITDDLEVEQPALRTG